MKYTKASFVRWIYFNPETGVFIETMPQGPNLLGMSGGLSLARALMFATEAEARSWEKDVKQLNSKFRVAKVILEYEADKCPETVDCGPCEKCLTAKGYKDTPCFHKCAKHNK